MSQASLSEQGSLTLPIALREVVQAAFARATEAESLLGELLRQPSYDRRLIRRLLQVARGHTEAAWDLRQLATLALEHQITKLDPQATAELDYLFGELGLWEEGAEQVALTDDILRQGFSSRESGVFAEELLRWLGRNARVHRALDGFRTSPAALADFIALARRACRLHFARFLFDPHEVARRITAATRTSGATPSPYLEQNPFSHAEARRTLERLPIFERTILDDLIQAQVAYWVAAETPAEINSLVEYPLTTVVLVVKPGGSCAELELKRAGLRREAPLGAVFERDGRPVPKSHRLDGGSFGHHLEWESQAAARVARLFRHVHGEEAPLPAVVALSTVDTVPFGGERLPPRDYFDSPHVFGQTFDAVQSAIDRSVAAFFQPPRSPPAEETATESFLGYARLSQSMVVGTSSFRLDKLSTYLSDKGPEVYFRDGLGRDYDDAEARCFADELLEEILPQYVAPQCAPPATDGESYGAYVRAALAGPQNRALADAWYSRLVQRVAKFWGTLLATGSGSSGECFVPRNVGLRRTWNGGEWRIEVVFLDHDALRTATATLEDFWPEHEMLPIVRDEYYIRGGHDELGALQALASIYHVDASTIADAEQAFHLELKRAFDATRAALEATGRLDDVLHPSYQRKLLEWHELVRLSLTPHGVSDAWKTLGEGLLRAGGWHEKLIRQAVAMARRHTSFFDRYAFLYEAPESTR
ncbi:MAG: hypothetical protein AAF657_04170 [Acidobacteriota bacterium]